MGQTNIRYTDESINTAFSAFYVIPEYQREYVWEKTQVKQLMEDLLDAYTSDKNKAYFLGTIVTCSANGDFELVDGQQRLTTFFIILCIVKKLYAEYGIPTASIDQLICGTSLNQYGVPVTRYRLELQHQNVTNCLELIAKGEPRPSDVSKTGGRLFDAAEVVEQFMRDNFADITSFGPFAAFLLYKSSFVRIDTQNVVDALKMFETINERGKNLDPIDLLKNMLFTNVQPNQFAALNTEWKSVINELERIDEKPLRFLRYFIMAKYDVSKEPNGVLREDRIFAWLKANKKQCPYASAPFKFVQGMKDSASFYANCKKPANSWGGGTRSLKNIPLLAGTSYRLHLMLLLAASNMEPAVLDRFEILVESIVYYTVINRVTTNDIERIFVKWCGQIRGIKTSDELDTFISSSVLPEVSRWKEDNEANFMRLGLNSMQQYRVKFIMAKLSAYVNGLRTGNGMTDEPTSEELSRLIPWSFEIEHIMPQTCADKAQYGVDEDEFSIIVNRLGNLTLLESTINRSIHNSTYQDKCVDYRQSTVYLTSSLPELVDVGKNNAITKANEKLKAWPEWNKASIMERQAMLYKLSEEIWMSDAIWNPKKIS